MGFVESLRSIIYDILHNLDRIHVDLIKSNGLNPLRIRHDSGGLLEFRNDGKVYYNGTEIVTSSGGVSDHDALNNLNWAAAGHTIDSNIAMGTNVITGLGAHAANGNAVRYEHLAADEHTQYLLIDGTRAMSNDLDIGNNYINNCNIINMDAGFHPAAYIKPIFTDPTYDLEIWGESEIMFFNGSLGSETESISITTEHLDLHSNAIVNGAAISATSLDVNGGAITDAIIAGINNTSFIIDQNNAGAGVSSSLRFNRGSTDGDAAIWWDETDDVFQFESDVGVTVGNIKVANIAASKVVTGNHGTATTDEVVNICYGTSATPPTASTTTEGALYIQYTA